MSGFRFKEGTSVIVRGVVIEYDGTDGTYRISVEHDENVEPFWVDHRDVSVLVTPCNLSFNEVVQVSNSEYFENKIKAYYAFTDPHGFHWVSITDFDRGESGDSFNKKILPYRYIRKFALDVIYVKGKPYDQEEIVQKLTPLQDGES